MDLSTLNWLAIIAATIANFAIGSIWYSTAVFGKQWMKENKFTEEELKKSNMTRVFGFYFLFSFVIAFNLAIFFK